MPPASSLWTLPLLGTLMLSLVACDSNPPPASKPPTTELPVAEEITLVSGCNSCHGEDGVGNNPEVPFIAGQHADYLERAMREYLIGDRKHELMRAAVFDLDVSERHQLATHFAQLKTPWKKTRSQDTADASANQAREIRAGKALARPCAGCHGDDGNSIKEGVPSLAGLQPDYFIPALKSYLEGKRQGAAIMKNFKLSLSDRDIRRLATYFAAQQRQRSPLGNRLQASDASDELAHRCLGCHGKDGNSMHPAIPSLAGQNAAYLIKAMQTYRDKKRQNEMMVDVAQGLSNEAIRRNAIFFATRTPRHLSKQQATHQTGSGFDPMGEASQLAASCNACHGDQGNSSTPGVPRLAGLAQAYLQQAMGAYRDGQRQHGMMQMLTRYLSDTDLEKLALYYASQSPVSTTVKTPVSTELAENCAGCHGEDGNSSTPTTPSLAGQNADYLASALQAYQKGKRKNEDMQGAASELDAQAIRTLANHYSQLAPKQAKVRPFEDPQSLAQKCDRCHGKNGGEPDPNKPRIAGQREAYLVKALLAFKNKERLNTTMYKMVGHLSRTEIEAIAHHYANQ